MRLVEAIFDWTLRLLPAAAVFSMLFAIEGSLRWVGLLGFVPLVLAFRRDCPTCDPRARSCDRGGSAWRGWPGH